MLVGALAEADILGIFGREEVAFANMWEPPQTTDPTAYTFRLYRNYDGNGSMFGDVSVSATSFDQTQLAVYGAQRSSDNGLTLVVINKTANELTSSLSLANFNAAAAAHVYTYSSANLQGIVAQLDLPVANSALTASFPAQSISMIVVPQSAAPLSRTGWKASASSSASGTYNSFSQQPASALDGNIRSRWSSGRSQSSSGWFQVDMGSPQSFSSITLNAGASTNDFPSGYQIYTSGNGTTWSGPIAQGKGTSALVTVTFPRQTARFLKIVQSGAAKWWWSIAELNVSP